MCNLSVRASNSAKQAPLQPMQEFRPMAVLHVDLVGPLPSGKTSRGHTGFQYIMTVVDSATRYLWLVPLRRKTSDAVAAALFEEVISRTTIPDALHTDRGPSSQTRCYNTCASGLILATSVPRRTTLKVTVNVKELTTVFTSC